MSYGNILGADGLLSVQYRPKINTVATLASGSGAPVAIAQNITLPYSGLYALQTYIAKVGAGSVDSTSSTVFSCDASQGWGRCCFTPQMIPPFATEPGVPVSMTSTFYASAGPTVLRLAPGTALNVGATGNCEAILWYIGPSA